MPKAGADRQRREPQALRANRRAGKRQHGVEADGPHQRALARHVRAAHDETELPGAGGLGRGPRLNELLIAVAPGISGCATRSRRTAALLPSTSSGNGSAGCSYEYPASDSNASISPTASTQSRSAGRGDTATIGRVRHLQREQQRDLGQAREHVVSRVGPIGDPRQPRDAARRRDRAAVALEPLRERQQRRLVERLALDLADHVRQQVESGRFRRSSRQSFDDRIGALAEPPKDRAG